MQQFSLAAWDIVWAKPDATAEECRQALEWAQTAFELDPRSPHAIFTLGLALYRNGKYKAAIEVNEQAYRIDSVREPKAVPDILAATALSYFYLGDIQKAEETLARLDDPDRDGRYAQQASTWTSAWTVREARKVIRGHQSSSHPPEKPAPSNDASKSPVKRGSALNGSDSDTTP